MKACVICNMKIIPALGKINSLINYNSVFSAGDTLAIGSQNGSIYLFRVSRDGFSYKKSNKIRGAQALVQLDWSLDGNYLQTVTADYDLAFCKFIFINSLHSVTVLFVLI